MAEYLWRDRRRRAGLPLSFTKYALNSEVLVRETGLLNLKEETVQLYRVRDIELVLPLNQRMFRTGTIVIHSSDKTAPELMIQSVKNPRDVKELIFSQVEEAKAVRRMRTTEILDDDVTEDAADGDVEA